MRISRYGSEWEKVDGKRQGRVVFVVLYLQRLLYAISWSNRNALHSFSTCILCAHFEIVYSPSVDLQQIHYVVNESQGTVQNVSRNLDGKNREPVMHLLITNSGDTMSVLTRVCTSKALDLSWETRSRIASEEP